MVERSGNCVWFRDDGLIGVFASARLADELKKMMNALAWSANPDGSIWGFVRDDYDSMRYLASLGLRHVVPFAPIMRDAVPLVEGKHKAMRHQLLTAAFMTLHERCYVFNEPRMGKTGSVILAMDWLQRRGVVTGGVLIITTYTTLNSVWVRGIRETLPRAVVRAVHGKNKRERELNEVAEFYVTNYDSIRISQPAFMDAVREGRIGAVVIDEVTHVGNPGSKRSKAIGRLCGMPGLKSVVGLTGSPADDVEAVYGMARVVNPAKLPCSTLTGWRNLTTRAWGSQPWQVAPRKEAPEIINRTLKPAIRFKKSEVFDLPPVTEQVRECGLSKEQRKAMEDLRKQAVTLLNSGEDRAVVSAVHGAALMTKGLQIAEGIVRDDNGQLVELPHRERTDTIIEAIAETNRKVVIFSPFIAGCDIIRRDVELAGHSAEIINGSVTGKRRDNILRDFQEKDDPRVLVCHPITVGFGTELSAADTMIFSVPLQLGGFVYNQSLERLSSVKQKSANINIIHVISSKMEMGILKGLRENHEQGQLIAGFFELAVGGEFIKN